MVISGIRRQFVPIKRCYCMGNPQREGNEKASVEWVRCPGELKPQIKLIFSATLGRITQSTYSETRIKLIYRVIDRYRTLRIN